MNREPDRAKLIPVVELGVAEAYEVLTNRFGLSDLPPLEAIENEDWGRDSLLSRFLDLSSAELADAGLTWDEPDPPPQDDGPG